MSQPLIFTEAENKILYSTSTDVLDNLAYEMSQMSVRLHSHRGLNFVNGELVSLGDDLGGEMQAMIENWEHAAADLARKATAAADQLREDQENDRLYGTDADQVRFDYNVGIGSI